MIHINKLVQLQLCSMGGGGGFERETISCELVGSWVYLVLASIFPLKDTISLVLRSMKVNLPFYRLA